MSLRAIHHHMKLHPRLLIVTLSLAVAFNGCSAEAKKERRLDRAEKNFKAGDYDKAKIDYFGALQLDPKNATAIQRLGLIWSEQGAPLRALPFLLKTRELNPNDFEARKKLAVALASIGQMDEARKEAIAILRHDPADGDALLRLFETVRTPEQVAAAEEELNKFPAKDSAEFHIAAATMALRKNDRAAAERELAEALKTGSTMAVVHTAAGTMALLTNDRTKAGEEFKKAAELSPLRSSARIKHAEFLLATGAGDAAQAALTEITAKAPDYVPAWRLLSQIALSKKDYKGAATLLENVFSRDPQDLDARAIEANIFVAQGEPKKALEVLERVDTSYEGKVPGIKLQLAKAAVMAGNPNQAQTALQQALAMNPEYPEAILALAELNLRSGQTAPAMTALQELLNKRPDLPQTRVLLAAGLQASVNWTRRPTCCGSRSAAFRAICAPLPCWQIFSSGRKNPPRRTKCWRKQFRARPRISDCSRSSSILISRKRTSMPPCSASAVCWKSSPNQRRRSSWRQKYSSSKATMRRQRRLFRRPSRSIRTCPRRMTSWCGPTLRPTNCPRPRDSWTVF